MNKQVLVPDIGDFEKVEIIEVLVKPGDNIKKNDSLITLESDKSSVEVPSTEEGKIEKLNVKVGDKVSKGDLILSLISTTNDEDIKSIFNTIDIQNRKNTTMDLRDVYINLCPLDYNINMIKMNDMVKRVNQYPGYVEDVFIDLTRQIKSDEPLPTTADFFK